MKKYQRKKDYCEKNSDVDGKKFCFDRKNIGKYIETLVRKPLDKRWGPRRPWEIRFCEGFSICKKSKKSFLQKAYFHRPHFPAFYSFRVKQTSSDSGIFKSIPQIMSLTFFYLITLLIFFSVFETKKI